MNRFRMSFACLLLVTLSRFFIGFADRPPNIVVIMTDDQGYADVGFNGGTDIPTPNMDRIAEEGVVFTDGYATYSVCGPSRAGFITGRYPQRFGFERNPAWRPANPDVGLPREEQTLAEALRPLGYTSGVIGKWHLGSHKDVHPLSRGFDEFYGHLGGGHRYFPEELYIPKEQQARNEPESYLTWIHRGFEPVRTQDYLTYEFTREALTFVSKHQEKPFFLFLSYNAPHAPLQAPAEEMAKFSHIEDEKRQVYAAMVSVVDQGIGKLFDLLDELELTEDTLIFFCSDNGGPFRTNGSSNAPLRGGKSDPWEGGFRVPFAMRWPGVVPAGLRYSEPVSLLDIFGTVAGILDLPENPSRVRDGVNLIPFLTGEKEGVPHERIYLRMFDKNVFAMREGIFKLVQPQKLKVPRLFNLQKDISESKNVSDWNTYRFDRMKKEYENWNQELIPPAFPGLDMKEWRNPKIRPLEDFQ